MKTHLKAIALFLSVLIIFQGCTVYKSANVTLDEASKSEIKVKVRTKTNETIKFKRIGFENGHYYGVQNIYGDMIKTKIDEKKVEKVQLKDKSLSAVLSIGIPLVLIGAVIVIVADGLTYNVFPNGF